jgi:hypothetical protein
MLVDIPDVNLFDKGVEGLIDFYKALGWDPEKHYIKIQKILLNLEDQQTCCNKFLATKEDKSSLPMLWVDKGPAGCESVPKGKVKLEEGWIFN